MEIIANTINAAAQRKPLVQVLEEKNVTTRKNSLCRYQKKRKKCGLVVSISWRLFEELKKKKE